MFTVNSYRHKILMCEQKISKHFMFTVNKIHGLGFTSVEWFQNISCLRLIIWNGCITLTTKIFQNISCLRLIQARKEQEKKLKAFQNISCLRLIFRAWVKDRKAILFQNISCLRLILAAKSLPCPSIIISKHFMFTVNLW